MNTKERLMEIVEMSGSLTAVEVYDFFCIVLDEKDRKIAKLEERIQRLENFQTELADRKRHEDYLKDVIEKSQE